jgi:hypothetical protein
MQQPIAIHNDILRCTLALLAAPNSTQWDVLEDLIPLETV